ncbi:MAG: flagellar basal body P-ring formation chaperone FlgA [Alphaproteobacteria bacterium]
MKKLLFPIFYPRFTALAVALFLYLFISGAANAVELRNNNVIEGSVITLGDIFYNLPANEDKVLGPAPRPGAELVLDARTLLRVARALDLPWRPVDSSEFIVLERAATLITADEIENELIDAIKTSGYHGDFELSLPHNTTEIILPQDQPGTFEISDLDINSENDFFSAIIYAPNADNPLQTMRVSGKMHQVVNVPVLKDTLRNGHLIRARDIGYQKMRAKTLNHDVILSADELIGMTPRRMIFTDKPIKMSEIEAPQIVQRGQNITMIFKNGSMELTAMGKALENGAKGDLIRVVNASSSRTVSALVTAEKEVRIQNF